MNGAIDRGFTEAVDALKQVGALLQQYGLPAGLVGGLIVFVILWKVMKVSDIIIALRRK